MSCGLMICKKLSLLKGDDHVLVISVFTDSCWIKAMWTSCLYYFSHFPTTCFLPLASTSHLPAAVGTIHLSRTLYFSSNNPECCVLGRSFTVARGMVSTLLFTARIWLMTFLTESSKSAYSRNGLRKLLEKFFRGQELADFVKQCAILEFTIS